MSKSYLAQVTIPHDSGLPEDSVVNTFSFIGEDVITEVEESALKTRLGNFYNAVQSPGTLDIASWLSPLLNPASTRLKLYRREDPPPRVPVFDSLMAIDNVGTSPLPSEVALCLSFRAAPMSGVPQARRRGRVFIGPLATSAVSGITDTEARPLPGLINSLLGAATSLQIASNAMWTWVVHSTTAGDATVVGGWVDNAFDTQRRRGRAATVRSTWGA